MTTGEPAAGAGRARYGMTVPFDGVPLHEHRRWFDELAGLGYSDVWSSEVDGSDGFTPLALAAAWTPSLHLGVAIAPAFTRGPALLAQTVAAMAEAAPGRFAFGLGASSDVIVERWNGIAYDDPFKRTRDTLRFLRAALGGERVDEAYDTFAVRGFRLSRPVDRPPPLYLAALRPGMLRLAGREADGVILNWLSADDVPKAVAEVGPGKEVVARLFVLPNGDADVARASARRLIASYLNVRAYAAFHRWLGRGPCSSPCGRRGPRATARGPWPPSPMPWWTTSSSTGPPTRAVTTWPGTWPTASPCRSCTCSRSGSTWPTRSARWPRRPQRPEARRPTPDR